MCGIAGFLGYRGDPHGELKKMLGCMVHRGPEDEGIYIDRDKRLAFGHRRLSIIDLTDSGKQPMRSNDGRYLLTYNGEIYNYRELRDLLKKKGAIFHGASDSEVLLNAICEWGLKKTLSSVRGMFAFALYDYKKKQVFLIKDRFGEKPLYYGQIENVFYFASDIAAIHRVGRENGLRINGDVLSGFIKYGYIAGNQSIYEGIYSLEPGTVLVYDIQPGVAHKYKYWSYEVLNGGREVFDGTLDDAVDKLEEILSEAVRIQLQSSDVPIGVNLSGGIDSSLVAAIAQKQSKKTVKTFSIGFENQRFNETIYAKQIAAHLGTDHHELYMQEDDAKELIPHISEAFTEPFADISELPTLLVSRFAKKDVTVVISGDGGDELFGGYNRYHLNEGLYNRTKRVPKNCKRLSRRLMRSGIFSDARITNRLSLYCQNTPEEVYDWQFCDIPFSDRTVTGLSHGIENRILYRTNNKLSIQEHFMLTDVWNYLPYDILVKVDRAGMYYSLENRIPLLDVKVAEFAVTLPVQYKLQGNNGKVILKKLLERYIPKTYFDRPKMGFGIPIGDWIRNDKKLHSWAADLLSPYKIRNEGYLDEREVSACWKLFGKKGMALNRVWNMLMFESWLESYKD